MANRALNIKRQRATKQSIEAGFAEHAKLSYWRNDNLDEQYRAMRAAIADIHPSRITRCPPGEAHGLQRDVGRLGRKNASISTKTYGNGERPYHDAAKRRYYDQYAPLNRQWDIYTT